MIMEKEIMNAKLCWVYFDEITGDAFVINQFTGEEYLVENMGDVRDAIDLIEKERKEEREKVELRLEE